MEQERPEREPEQQEREPRTPDETQDKAEFEVHVPEGGEPLPPYEWD